MTWVLLCTILSLLGRGSLIPNVGAGCHQQQTIKNSEHELEQQQRFRIHNASVRLSGIFVHQKRGSSLGEQTQATKDD